MDFKSRFPNFNSLSLESYESGESPFPFDDTLAVPIMEFNAPGGGVFYGLGPFLSQDESVTVDYLTDSDSSCKMRHAFEFGEISWTDFWLSRPWLIRVDVPFPMCEGNSPARYITPREMENDALRYLKMMDHQSPLELKRERLMMDISVLGRFSEFKEMKLKEKLLQDFERDFGHLLELKSA